MKKCHTVQRLKDVDDHEPDIQLGNVFVPEIPGAIKDLKALCQSVHSEIDNFKGVLRTMKLKDGQISIFFCFEKKFVTKYPAMSGRMTCGRFLFLSMTSTKTVK